MKKRIILILTAVIFIAAAAPVFSAETGEQAPAFVLPDINKNYAFSKKIYFTGWVLVDFYATWCENCNEELPHIEELYNEYSDRDFKVILMATDKEGLDIVKPFFAERPTPVTVLIDKYQKSVQAFGVEALPTLFLINPEGEIVFKTVGYHEEDVETLRSILSEALDG